MPLLNKSINFFQKKKKKKKNITDPKHLNDSVNATLILHKVKKIAYYNVIYFD